MTCPGWTRPVIRPVTVDGVTTAHPPLPLRRLRERELIAVDALLAVGLAALCGYAATEAPAAGPHEPVWLSWAVGLALGLPVVLRRYRPLTVAGTVLVVAAVALLSGIIPGYAVAGPSAALACAFYLVGVAVPRRRSVAALLVGLAVFGVAVGVQPVVHGSAADDTGVAFADLLIGAAWVVGRAARQRRAYAARSAEQATERAVDAERLRIARELHDVLGHSMSLIAVKAAIANHVAEERPQEVREALRVIERTSRGALTEIRRVLGVLRAETAFAPSAGLADLPALAGWAESAGVTVDLDLPPDGTALPEGIGLAVYRIVQESLTNVVRHAAPARCRVTVTLEPGRVRLGVADDGTRAPAPAAGGQGIIGMRERAAAYGGDFTAGPAPGGGFTVTAILPYEAT
jgi:signal transduction histidine kinase